MRPGWAGRPDVIAACLSHRSFPQAPEPSYAVADAYEPPHPNSLPVDLCRAALDAAKAVTPVPGRPNGAYYLPELDDDTRAAIIAPFAAANAMWWQLDLDAWHIGVKHYRTGEGHPQHQDMHPAGGARRKFAGIAQLSDPDTYDGGDLVVTFAHHRIAMPRTVGTVIAMPGWTNHEVTPVTRGNRWSLICNANGPKPR